jgi:hypothetical protein
VVKYWLTARSRRTGIAILQHQQNGYYAHDAGEFPRPQLTRCDCPAYQPDDLLRSVYLEGFLLPYSCNLNILASVDTNVGFGPTCDEWAYCSSYPVGEGLLLYNL